MSIPLSTVETGLKMVEAVVMARIDELKAEVRERDATIKMLQERIAQLEEANASRGESRPITKEEWQENFK